MPPFEPVRQSQTFRVTLRTGVWNVSRDGVFFGDYVTRGNAIRAAYAGARTEEGRGRVAQVLEPPGTVALPHHETHFGA